MPAPTDSVDRSSDRATVADRAARVRFRRALSLMAMTLVLPGSAQLTAGNRKVGLTALAVWIPTVAIGMIVGLTSLLHHEFAFWLASNTSLLLVLRLFLMLGAIGWGALFVDAWRIGQPLSLAMGHRRAVVGLNGILCFSIAGTMLFGAHLVGVQRDFMLTMFSNDEVVGAHEGRFNVLLLGGDSGSDRWGMRPDSMTVASIDANTGKSVLISLPRNMANFPFAKGSVMREQFPEGFDCDDCYLNGVSTWAQDNTALFGTSENPGTDATIMAIEGITGLKINYWAMVNMKGFEGLVDAVGGVELNVRDRIPVGGLGSDVTGYIEPGKRLLNGHDTLWFARAREGSDDYSRMARQKCVMGAMLQQISPQSALKNFSRIAKASSDMISTNVPGSEVDRFVALALKARAEPMATVSLVPPMINTADPDIPLVKRKIQEAIDKAEGKKVANASGKPGNKAKKTDQAKAPAPNGGTPAVTGGSVGSLSEGYAANQSEDLGSAC